MKARGGASCATGVADEYRGVWSGRLQNRLYRELRAAPAAAGRAVA